MRVASLVPSATETVAALDPDTLVARSHRCDYPSAVRDLPRVTTSKLDDDPPADAAAIDEVVDDHGHGDGTYFRVLRDALRAADPDLLLTQSLCEVCAVPESMTRETMAALDPPPDLLTLGPTTLSGVLDSVERVGEAIDRPDAAGALIADLRERLRVVEERRPDPDRPPRVVCVEWTDPLRCHGLWIPDALERLGADVGFGAPGEHGRVIDWADVRVYDPEVLVVSPCGRSIPEIREDMATLTDRDGWEALAAVEDDRVFLLDGRLSSRHGPRVVRALELLAPMVYPDTFEPPGDGAVRFG